MIYTNSTNGIKLLDGINSSTHKHSKFPEENRAFVLYIYYGQQMHRKLYESENHGHI